MTLSSNNFDLGVLTDPIRTSASNLFACECSGGVTDSTCPYRCMSEKYQMPHCYTPIEELIYALGGPWWFTIFLSTSLVFLALVLSVARMKLIGNEDFSGPSPTPHGAQIDHSFPFLESLNEVFITLPAR
jgi:hypothetical protein